VTHVSANDTERLRSNCDVRSWLITAKLKSPSANDTEQAMLAMCSSLIMVKVEKIKKVLTDGVIGCIYTLYTLESLK